MTAPARQPKTATPPPATLSDELRPLARVLRQCIGVIVLHWDALGLAPGHPYRHAARMLDCYLKQRYEV